MQVGFQSFFVNTNFSRLAPHENSGVRKKEVFINFVTHLPQSAEPYYNIA